MPNIFQLNIIKKIMNDCKEKAREQIKGGGIVAQKLMHVNKSPTQIWSIRKIVK